MAFDAVNVLLTEVRGIPPGLWASITWVVSNVRGMVTIFARFVFVSSDLPSLLGSVGVHLMRLLGMFQGREVV